MLTQDYQTLIPARGRDYGNKSAVEKDFRDGKDFQLQSFMLTRDCSIRDFTPKVIVNIRYAKLMKVCSVKV